MPAKDTEWLKELKPGDQVACNKGSYGVKNYVILNITKITPTGIIKTSDGSQWTPSGREKGTPYARISWNLEPLTQEIRDYVEKERAIQYLKNAKLENLSLDTLRHIVGVIMLEITPRDSDNAL